MKRSNGFSLLEMVVYSLIFGLSLTGVYTVLIGTVQNYNAAQANIEVQQGAQAALNRIAQELKEASSSSGSITVVSGVGIVFLSARDSNNKIHYDSSSGLLLWQKRICYYLDTDPSTGSGSEYALFRKEETFTATTTPPATPSPNPDPDYVTKMRNNATLKKLLIARHFIATTNFSVTSSVNLYTINITSSTNTTGKSNSISLNSKVNVVN